MQEILGFTLKKILYQNKHFISYKAVKDDKQPVVLKMCTLEQPSIQDLSSLQHEFKILNQLDVQGIVKAYDLVKLHHLNILVLEDFEGETLLQYVSTHTVDLGLFFNIALQLVDIIFELHQRGIIHKDINPTNIIINPATQQVTLIEFGIASQSVLTTQEFSPVSSIEATIAYISPEQTGRMNLNIDHRTDFYSLGVTFFEILTGQLPFHAEDPLELLHSHIVKMPPALDDINSQIPHMISEIVLKLLSKMPQERYSSAEGLKADLLVCKAQWEANQTIEPFELSQQDVHNQLIISQNLYGREKEIELLDQVLDETAKGAASLLFISGYSGIGKTSLVKEIYKSISQKRGLFIKGKYDQLQRSVPYSAVIEAFEELVRRLLMESPEILEQIRTSLLEELGGNAQVIVDVIPNISLIIGPQPAVEVLSANENKNRFLNTFKIFISTLAHTKHPLIVFLDDLQWIDSASLELFELLVSDAELSYFLLIGAYRSNEVKADHPLSLWQKDMMRMGKPYSVVELTPLRLNDVQSLIGDSLGVPPSEVRSLAEITMQKTEGNPFFINVFLKKLHTDKLLHYSFQGHQWLWDIDKINDLSITTNVVDMLTEKIKNLSEQVQKILELAACIGHQFELKVLCSICEMPVGIVADALLQTIQFNLISPINKNYWILEGLTEQTLAITNEKITFRFIHDKVQQAAYALINEADRPQIHLNIARVLIKDADLENDDENLFTILDHYNQGLALITDPQEKRWIAEHNLLAGTNAITASAIKAAKKYLTAGLSILKTLTDYPQTLFLQLSKEIAICDYLLGDFDKAEAGFKGLLDASKDLIFTIEVYGLYNTMLAGLNRHRDAINFSRKALALVGIHIPKKVRLHNILKYVIKIKFQTRFKDVADLQLPEMTSEKYIAVTNFIGQLTNISYIADQDLFIFLVCLSISLSFKYGYNLSTSYTICAFCVIILHAFHRKNETLSYLKLYDRIIKLKDEGVYRGKNHFVLGAFIDPWLHSIDFCIKKLAKAAQESSDLGDPIYSNYSNFAKIHAAFCFGDGFHIQL